MFGLYFFDLAETFNKAIQLERLKKLTIMFVPHKMGIDLHVGFPEKPTGMAEFLQSLGFETGEPKKEKSPYCAHLDTHRCEPVDVHGFGWEDKALSGSGVWAIYYAGICPHDYDKNWAQYGPPVVAWAWIGTNAGYSIAGFAKWLGTGYRLRDCYKGLLEGEALVTDKYSISGNENPAQLMSGMLRTYGSLERSIKNPRGAFANFSLEHLARLADFALTIKEKVTDNSTKQKLDDVLREAETINRTFGAPRLISKALVLAPMRRIQSTFQELRELAELRE